MIHEVFMPALSSTMTEGKIVSWVKSPGDKIEKGETVVVVESDKADMDVESFYEGYLAVITVPAGETVPVGEAIALLAETPDEIETAKQQASQSSSASDSASTSPDQAPTEQTPTEQTQKSEPATVSAASQAQDTPSRRNGRTVASPRAKKLAKELKVELDTLTGSGPHGRIVAEDVEAAAGKTPQPEPAAAPQQPTPEPAAQPTATPTTPISVPLGEVVPFNTLQNAVVRNMVASLQVPSFRVGYTITTNELDKLYKQIKPKGVTMTALLAKAVAVTLKQHPKINASYTEKGIQYHAGVNVAVAVAMADGGLITPTLQKADEVDIYSLSRTWKGLVERSRRKQLQPEEYSSGTFTISNLGMYGVDRFDAILPPGQGAIMAIGASRPQVVATTDGMMGVRNQMQVNMTCDHRIIYGADAAAFLQDLAKLIETNPQSLTL
jgi:pyruvate dehydrogenase E2 component (dihydrolipoamide acetyltransferase)